MSVTLEVSIEDLVKNFAKASAKTVFRKPYDAALIDYRMGESTVDAPVYRLICRIIKTCMGMSP